MSAESVWQGVRVGEREEVIEEYMQTHAHSALTLFC